MMGIAAVGGDCQPRMELAMTDKISSRLSRLIEVGQDDEPVDLSVLMERNLPEQTIKASVEKLEQLGGVKIEYVPISGTLHCRVRLGQAKSVEQLDGVEQVDIESTAPIEELLDG